MSEQKDGLPSFFSVPVSLSALQASCPGPTYLKKKERNKQDWFLPEIGHLDSSLHHWSQQAAQSMLQGAALCCH